MTKIKSSAILLLIVLQQIYITLGELELTSNIRGRRIQHDDSLHQRLIVGGNETIPGRYPYQVGLVFNTSAPFCGGALIHSEWVLTAAHCSNMNNWDTLQLHAQIGRFNFTDPLEDFELIPVANAIIHPRFFPTYNYDYMLLKLSTPSNYTPVTIDDGNTSISFDTDVTTIGWGTTEEGGNRSEVLREVEMDYLPSFICQIPYLFIPIFRITPMMMCARRRGKDACQGDSGGPLIIKGQNSTEDVLVGLVSWGLGCARPFFPGVYARVSSAIDFIREYVPI